MAESADPGAQPALREWLTVLAVVVCRVGVAFFGTLVVAALLPVVTSWQGYVVTSGSMEPRISVGDVVLGRPMAPADDVALGRVFVFQDPADPTSHRLLVHRVVERGHGGHWVTAGDANADFDVEPAPRSAFRARAVVLVPLVGSAVNWWRTRQIGPLLVSGIAAGVALAIVLVVRPPSGGGGRGGGGRGGGGGSAGGRRRRRRRAARIGRSSVALPMVALTIALVASPALGTASSAFTATNRNPGNSWTVGDVGLQTYNGAVVDDDPFFFYYLDEASGPAIADASGNNRHGTASAVAGYRRSGALPNNPGYALDLTGGGRVVSGGSALSNPTTFTLELWFRTSSSAGGKLIGFESGTGSSSLSFDRHVTLRNDGRLVFGDWTASPYRTITSPDGYADGAWHHLVLTAVPRGNGQLDAVLYVDGAAVAAGATSRVAAYSGWWRVGQGRTGLGLTAGFPGQVDQVAVYRTALSADRVQAHYDAR
jgi:signal peptidase I